MYQSPSFFLRRIATATSPQQPVNQRLANGVYKNPCYIVNNTQEKIKLLDSDWLRKVQFKCNTSAKSVTPVQKV